MRMTTWVVEGTSVAEGALGAAVVEQDVVAVGMARVDLVRMGAVLEGVEATAVWAMTAIHLRVLEPRRRALRRQERWPLRWWRPTRRQTTKPRQPWRFQRWQTVLIAARKQSLAAEGCEVAADS